MLRQVYWTLVLQSPVKEMEVSVYQEHFYLRAFVQRQKYICNLSFLLLT